MEAILKIRRVPTQRDNERILHPRSAASLREARNAHLPEFSSVAFCHGVSQRSSRQEMYGSIRRHAPHTFLLFQASPRQAVRRGDVPLLTLESVDVLYSYNSRGRESVPLCLEAVTDIQVRILAQNLNSRKTDAVFIRKHHPVESRAQFTRERSAYSRNSANSQPPPEHDKHFHGVRFARQAEQRFHVEKTAILEKQLHRNTEQVFVRRFRSAHRAFRFH